MNSVSEVQVTLLLPLLRAESEQVTSTTVPGFTGNCAVVSIVPVHSVFSPVQPPDVIIIKIQANNSHSIFMISLKAALNLTLQ